MKVSRGIFLLFFIGLFLGAQDRDIKIGVLALRGEENALKSWSATADFLSGEIPEYRFSILPISFEDLDGVIQDKRVHFILCNTAQYVDLSSRYDVSRIVTMKRDILGESYTSFGGVFFTRSDREDLESLRDTRGRNLAAVDQISLGGWIALWRELNDRGIAPGKFFKSIAYLGTHDEVVYAVGDGRYDMGTVRTDTLENMAAEGLIHMEDFKLIPLDGKSAPPPNADFPCLVSTRLYPEWPLAKLPQTPSSLAEDIATSLISLSPDSPAARAAGIRGWTIPQNYQTVHDCFFELKIGPYRKTIPIRLMDIISQYLLWILLVFFTIVSLISVVFYILSLNRKLRQSEKQLKEMATYDLLTGLPNRRFFQDYAEKTLELCRRRGCRMALYYIDLDRFKPVNDTYGHETGDQLLAEVGQRLLKQMRKSDLCARIGGDEFVALIQDVEQDKGFDTVARRIINEISHPYFVNEREIKIGVSMGLSFYPDMGSDLEVLMRKADAALYDAKEKGRGSFRIYRES